MDLVAMTEFSRLPAIHTLIEDKELHAEVSELGREAVTKACRDAVAQARSHMQDGEAGATRTEIIAAVKDQLRRRPALFQRVINATGVLLHTNLGRAVMADAAWKAMEQAAGVCDLELDLSAGKRASRLRGVGTPLTEVTGAEAGLVVNNNAAAVMLALAALAGKRPTVVSRGHLVEIGGGFRLPAIVGASGSPLLEVGTTNRTSLADYAVGLDQGAGMILVVHRSNFVMSGYVAEPRLEQLVELGKGRGVPVVLDLGSGALLDLEQFGLPHELTVQKAVTVGLDAVCFSGDKLMGGPQAGLIVGAACVIETMRKHPLMRALRCDKIQLAGVVATIELYRRGHAEREVPLYRMLSQTPELLHNRVRAWRDAAGSGEIIEAQSVVGGGSLPEARISGYALALDTLEPAELLASLRRQDPPVIGHIARDRVLLHARSVLPEHDELIGRGLRAALTPNLES